ncbi:MAG: multi-sensor hybrid histidine kinase [Elusimicrobia bacterium]|nr:MAG: multi-sensor hybrid histidine kinase [Elusimicrobiota bacterium]KAF0154938.1 MAG: multi-sensor hybrid histidine kinase [Elusimicrobiota bacterium]
MSICRDMTTRKRAEEELRRSEEKYRALVETTGLGYLILDNDGLVVDANQEYVRQSGHSTLGEILGRTVVEWTTDFNKQANAEAVAKCVRDGFIRDLTAYYEDKKGAVTPIEVNATVVGEGDSRRILSLCRDITDRVKEQEALKRSEEKFSLVFRSSPYGQIITRVPDGLILDVNEALTAMSGYSREEMIGRTTTELRVWENEPFREKLLNGISGKGRARNLRFNFRIKNGESLPADYSGAVINIGGETHIISTIIDLSDKQRAEAALLEAQRLESLSMIAGGLAHDFNNMLACIMGNLSLLEMDLMDSKKKELLTYVAEALEGVNSCRSLMHQFSSFARGTKPARKRFSLCSIVSRAAALAMTGASSVLKVKTPQALPDIDGDESQIFQTVNNIVLNAAQAMPSGGTVTIELSEFVNPKGGSLPLDPGRYIRIDISDNGIGIPGDILARIFDPYFSTKGKGRGLGLSMAFSVARGHGGHIEAASVQGQGTRFSIYLPCLEVYSSCEPVKPTRPKLHKGSGLVLVLEDDESVTDMLTAMLRASGYTPVPAADGRTALRLFREKGGAGAFTAVLMDLVIPGGMGGKECLEELRKQDPAVAAVATSGYSDYPVMAGPEKYGFDSALPKPYSSEEFGKTLIAALDKAAERARGGAGKRKRSKK